MSTQENMSRKKEIKGKEENKTNKRKSVKVNRISYGEEERKKERKLKRME